MKFFIKRNQKILIVQLVIILFILILYLFSSKQYISRVTISPVYAKSVISSSNSAPLISIYTPSFASTFYLKELSNSESRDLILKDFLKTNSANCIDGQNLKPSIQVYLKQDNSFPISDQFMNIQVKSECKFIAKNYVIFLASAIHKVAIEKIQKAENKFLQESIETLMALEVSNLSDLEAYVSTRKEVLSKLIPLLVNEDMNSIDFGAQTQEFRLRSDYIQGDDIKINLSLKIPTSLRAAKAEFDFLSSMGDLASSSIGLISLNNKIENYKTKHNFSDFKLVNISQRSNVIVSNRNLYLALFFIFISLCFGYIQNTLKQYKDHNKMQ
jgi:hypothetical protein